MIDEFALQAVIDKQAITEQIYRYCRAVDRLDIPLGHSIWHDDAVADYGAEYYQGPGKGVIDTICAHHGQLLGHSHQITNILIALDGDSAGSEAYVTGTMRQERAGKLFQMGIWARYLDAWERRDGCWKITRREVVFDHEEIREVTPMGRALRFTRDRTDPSYAFVGTA
ncbi:MAG: nuclear transport factor 2 family protein [Novosphingobium sp.]